MTSTIRFGRIAGIDIGAHWTWLLVVGLVVWSLAAGVFPGTNPGLEPATYLAMALIAAALFFASLLAHELGHALAAKRDGVPIDGITLWVFGGVARFSAGPPTAGSELRIALAGPAVSLVLGVAGVALAVGVALPAEVDAVAYWLGTMNLLLLAFNLIPAFPLDGGRVVRALLWQWKGDPVRATRWAAAGGRGFGAGFIAAGFVLAVFAGSLSGLWLALIGFFVMSAAEAELQIVEASTALAGLRVGDVTVRRPVSVQPGLPLDRFFDDVFMRHRYTAYPVVADDAIGLMSFRDALAVPRERWPHTRVVDRMVPADRVLVLDADQPLADAFRALAGDELHRALVRDSGAYAGLLSVTDAARVLEAAERMPARVDAVWPTPVGSRPSPVRTPRPA
jgi:Zn-dependent protease/CBS domain-containing protein